ncbi:hypothetical protein [uncultured Mediterranean phage uvMED]|nr:hypothetical protein [Gammaproteobacteria bacterium]BAQ84977.1 hypothetical protein [uncultured Mediterranean phage uvMED]BAR14943.1 hypothetical protein [uncultured Mediterranean phage uvMED]|tara:strand:- start:2315 stop:2524 length:210 start_codon:yes stop_codon:yes gene_type:complete
MTYKYVDSNTKKDENVLSVDFAFSGDTTMEDAIEQIDTLVLNIDNDGDIDFNYHQPRMYSISHLSSILD